MAISKLVSTIAGIAAGGIGFLMPTDLTCRFVGTKSYLPPTRYDKATCQSNASSVCYCATKEAQTNSCELVYVTLPKAGWACNDTAGTTCAPQ